MSEKELKFCCGTCMWFQEIFIPKEDETPVDWTPRGNCYFNPPVVYPIPKQQRSSLALAQGQAVPGQVTMVPIMLRPILDKADSPCGKYGPNAEMRELISEYNAQGGCGACEEPCGEECNCES